MRIRFALLAIPVAIVLLGSTGEARHSGRPQEEERKEREGKFEEAVRYYNSSLPDDRKMRGQGLYEIVKVDRTKAFDYVFDALLSDEAAVLTVAIDLVPSYYFRTPICRNDERKIGRQYSKEIEEREPLVVARLEDLSSSEDDLIRLKSVRALIVMGGDLERDVGRLCRMTAGTDSDEYGIRFHALSILSGLRRHGIRVAQIDSCVAGVLEDFEGDEQAERWILPSFREPPDSAGSTIERTNP